MFWDLGSVPERWQKQVLTVLGNVPPFFLQTIPPARAGQGELAWPVSTALVYANLDACCRAKNKVLVYPPASSIHSCSSV